MTRATCYTWHSIRKLCAAAAATTSLYKVTMADPMRAQLHAGDTLRIRYAGAKPSSTQGRAWRTIRIIVGPHEDYNSPHARPRRDGGGGLTQ